MLRISPVFLLLLLAPSPCLAQSVTGFEAGPFNADSPRQRQIQGGTGVGISRRTLPSPATSGLIGTTLGSTVGTTVGSTVGSNPSTTTGSTFGSATGLPVSP